MLPITLDTQTQTNLFQTNESSAPHFELQVVSEGLFPEVRLYYLENKKTRRVKSRKEKSLHQKNKSSLKKNDIPISLEYQHVIKLAV